MSENQIEVVVPQREIELLEKKRKVSLEKLFSPEGMDLMIAEIEKEAKTFTADVTTKEGQKEIKSMAYKVSLCKGVLEKLGKEVKEDHKKIIDNVNSQFNAAVIRLDALRDFIRKPVDDIEEAEEKFAQERNDKIAELEKLRNAFGIFSPIEELEAGIAQANALMAFEWGDLFAFKAKTVGQETLKVLITTLEAAKKQIADKARLEELERESAARAKKDREEEIAREAAAKATKEAEEKAERERKAAEEREKKAKKDAEEAAEKLRIAEEQAIVSARKAQMLSIGLSQEPLTGTFILLNNEAVVEITTSQFLKKSSKEDWEKLLESTAAKVTDAIEKKRIKDEKKAKEDTERAAAEAVKKEQERVAEQKRLDDLADAERERLLKEAAEKIANNKKHRAKINNEVLEVFEKIAGRSRPEEFRKNIIEAIAAGEVPHIQINY